MLLQILLSGLATGSIYALVAISLIIVYKATQTINFAQGEMLMLSAFVSYTCLDTLKLDLPLTVLVTVAFSALMGVALERVVIRPAIHSPHFNILIITLGASISARGLAGIIWTQEQIPYPPVVSEKAVRLAGLTIAPISLWIIAVSLLLMGILFAFFKYTKVGTGMRAASQNQRAALLMGISVKRVFSLSWAVSAVIGALAGILIAPVTFLSTGMGLIVINAFSAAILGGFGSFPGAVVGGMLLGIIENLAPFYLPSQVKYSVPFLILIAILLVKPSGLFGAVQQRRV